MQQIGLGQPHAKESKWTLTSTLYTKIHSEWIKDLNLTAKAINSLEENIGVTILALGFGNVLLDIISKLQATKEKNRYISFHPNEHFYIKGHYQESEKGKLQNERKYLQPIYLISV